MPTGLQIILWPGEMASGPGTKTVSGSDTGKEEVAGDLCGSGCGGTAVAKGCGALILAASELEVEATGSRPSWGLKELKFSCMLATNKMPGQGGYWNAL